MAPAPLNKKGKAVSISTGPMNNPIKASPTTTKRKIAAISNQRSFRLRRRRVSVGGRLLESISEPTERAPAAVPGCGNRPEDGPKSRFFQGSHLYDLTRTAAPRWAAGWLPARPDRGRRSAQWRRQSWRPSGPCRCPPRGSGRRTDCRSG